MDSPNPSTVQEVQDLAHLQAQMQKPALHANRDGGFELGWGTAILFAGLVPYFNAAMPKSFWISPWTNWMSYLPLLCMAFAPYAIPKLVKRFVTWPRTGYVANPNELKLTQLLMLMAFGLVLGFVITRAMHLVWDIRELSNPPGQPGPHIGGGTRGAILHGAELVIGAALTFYLARKVIRKRPPPPTAYDAAQLTQRLKQIAVGRKQVRVVKATMLGVFLGIPLMLCGVVLGLMWLSKAVMSHAEIHGPQWGALSFLLATNAVLYLMANGVALKQHRWKWLILVVLLIGPIFLAPLVPNPTIKPELAPVLQLFPPSAFLFIGLAWFLSGAATLILFIRDNPLPSAETA